MKQNGVRLPPEVADITGDLAYTEDGTGLSGACIRLYDGMVLKISPIGNDTARETAVLHKMKDILPVPRILKYVENDGLSYLLMSRIEGKMLCDETYMRSPAVLLDVLYEAFERLWNVDVGKRKCSGRLEARAERNVMEDLIEIDPEASVFSELKIRTPREALEWIKANMPDRTDPVCSHGDLCLPNILGYENRLRGFVDVSEMGVEDRWYDIAVCQRSLQRNFAGIYGGISYPGYTDTMLTDRLGIVPDLEKMRYYSVLYALL